MPCHSTAIANVFLRRAHRDEKPLTQMQLQKLVYIAHGWNLAISRAPLTDDSPRAWDYGPVYPDLWSALRKYGRGAVTSLIKVGDYGAGIFQDDAESVINAALSNDETDLIDRIYDLYSDYHAYQLSAMTHQDGTPWHNVYVTMKNIKGKISNNSIREHFVELAQTRQPA